MTRMLSKSWLILVLASLLFLFIYLPFLQAIPYLDGNIDFVQAHDFYTGGFSRYFANWGSVHPPLKIILVSILWRVFGFGVLTYNLLGLILGILGMVGIFGLARKYNDKTAIFAVLFLATSPLFWAVSLFSLTDFMLSVWLLLTLAFYVRRKLGWVCFFSFLAVMTKETGLLLPMVLLINGLIFLLVDRPLSLKKILNNLLFFSLPLIGYWLWGFFLKLHDQGGWSDWIFSETAGKGSFYTILHNLATFGFLNKYAYQNWSQLLFVNSNWVYLTTIIVLSFILVFFNKHLFTRKDVDLLSVIGVALIFSLGYSFTALSFPTYTITRYGLPVVVLIYFLTAVALGRFPFFKSVWVLFLVLLLVNLVSLFRSVDSIALQKWGTISILGQRFYNLPAHLAGNDGITYNFSYLKIVQDRSRAIYAADDEGRFVKGDCYWIFPDPNNDFKTIKNLELRIPLKEPCRSLK